MQPLIDTNIVSELMRREPDEAVLAWARSQTGFQISVIALEELIFGLTRKSMSLKLQWLDDFLLHQCEVLPVSAMIARSAGILRGRLAAGGVTRHPADMLIAATALIHRIPLATRNSADFEGCEIQIINPFRA
ncbi:PIN domain-containing protein [bacterium]|nr:PIN domain-containing protein [bacterium]